MELDLEEIVFHPTCQLSIYPAILNTREGKYNPKSKAEDPVLSIKENNPQYSQADVLVLLP